MASLVIRLAHDPSVLLEAAAQGFLRGVPREGGGDSARGDPGASAPTTGSPAFPSPSYLLALRQGGLRDDLLALAARRGVPGWFDPPLCTFQELPSWLGAGERKPLGAFERLALIGSIARGQGGETMRRLRRPDAYVAALDRFFGELASEGVAPEALEAAQQGSPERDDFALRRDLEVAAVYRAYLAELAARGRRDGRDTHAACAAEIRRDPAGLAARLGGRREIRIVGLQDLRGGWRALLAALVQSPVLDEVAIYTSAELELGAAIERLAETEGLAGRLFGATLGVPATSTATQATTVTQATAGRGSDSGRPADFGRRTVTGRAKKPGNLHQLGLFGETDFESESESESDGAAIPVTSMTPTVQLIVAPDAQREVEEVARRVRALVDGGVEPHRIAVVARDARPQLEMAGGALRRLGLPVTARERTGLGEVPVVRALLELLGVAAEGWTRHGLAELAEQPYLGVELDAGVINTVGYRTRVQGLAEWEEALERLLVEALERKRKDEAAGEQDENGHRRPLPPAWRVEKTRDQLKRLRGRLEELGEKRSLVEWLAWLRRVLEKDELELLKHSYLAPEGRAELVRLDLAGLKGVAGIAGEWQEALAEWGGGEERLDVGEFAARLADELDADVALWSNTRRGVQVLEGLAAAYRSFEHVFLVGLEAGRFPRSPWRSPLLDTLEREALVSAGLPLDGRAAWELRERELFRSLVAGARSLTVSHARLDASGREVAESSFVEALKDAAEIVEEKLPPARVLTPGLPVCASDRCADAARVAGMERRRQAGLEGVENGVIEDPALLAWLAERFDEEKVWSPTQLEAFAKCPWAYFSARVLWLEKPQDPDTEMEPTTRGTILHDALRRFFDAAVQRAGGPVLLSEDDLEWARPAMARALGEAIAEAGKTAWLGHPSLRPVREQELRRLLDAYLEFEVLRTADQYNPKKWSKFQILRTGVIEHEKAIDDVVLERGGVRFRFRGFIDRVEIGIDERVPEGERDHYVAAVDYKTTKFSTPGGG
ncbi:MAG TPA: PD-(D/E)XK nuclease family protein, partial [Longimicrobiales bacterium]